MDHKIFFDRVRPALFGGALLPDQVGGMEAMLDAVERAGWRLSWAAYGLATAYHETARRMQPVMETRQPSEARNPSVDEAIRRLEKSWREGKLPWVKRAYWRKDENGRSWLGRGLPQTTHRANYAWAQERTGVPFLTTPDLMLQMQHSLPVMMIGMEEGLYTGVKLADHLNGPQPNYREARRIINGTESADKVASAARVFAEALRAAGYGVSVSEPSREVRKTDTPRTPIPILPPDVPAPEPAAPSAGFWARFLTALSRRLKG